MHDSTSLPDHGSSWGTFLLNRAVERECSAPSFCEGKRKDSSAQECSFLAKRKKLYSSPTGVLTANHAVYDGTLSEVKANCDKRKALLELEPSFHAKRRKLYSVPFGARAANAQVFSGSQGVSASLFFDALVGSNAPT